MVIGRIRTLLLAVLVIGLLGTLADLALLSHYEDGAQMIPLGLIALSLLAIGWHVLRPGAAAVRALQGAMLLLAAAAVVGMGLHANGAAEFQLEIDPSQSWRQLAGKVMRAHAPPLLAPGALLQLGLIGLIHTYRHPHLGGRAFD